MTDLIVRLNEFSSSWSQQMWQASWQGGMALLLVFAVSRAVRNMPVEMTCWLWRLAYLKFAVAALCMWSIVVMIPLPRAAEPTTVHDVQLPPPIAEPPAAIEAYQPAPLPQREMVAEPPAIRLSGMSWLILAWAAGVFFLAGRLAMQYIAMRRFVSRLEPVADEHILHDLSEASRRMNVKRLPEVRMTDEPTSPLLVGCIRPVIVLPALLLEQSHADERAVAIAHELAHVKRQDLLWNWLPALTRIAFFFHPLVWLAQREWRLTQETATDKLAIASSRLPTDRYAALLLELVSKCTAATRIPPTAIAVSDVYSQLNRRILAMQRFQNARSRRLFILCLLVLVAGGIGLFPWAISSREPGPNSSAVADDKGALTQFEKDYALGEKEVIKRIPPPYSAGRLAYYRANMSKQQVEAMPDGPSAFYFEWHDKQLQLKQSHFANPDLSIPLDRCLSMLCRIPPERVQGDPAVMQQQLSGDFIVRSDASQEEIIAALQPILDTALKTPVVLDLDETEVEVYVARGTFKLSNRVKSNQNVVVIESSGYQTAKSIEEAVKPGLAPRFDFQRTLEEIGKSIGVPVVSEIETPPKEKILCVAIRQIPINELNTRTFDIQAALDSLTAQTGLTFTKEKRKILTLTVKAAGAPDLPRQDVSSTQTEANETSEPSFESRLASAIEQFGDDYMLDEKQVVKRIFPALPVKRAGFFRIINNGEFPEIHDGPELCAVLHWRDNGIPFYTQMTTGVKVGQSIRNLLPSLCRIGRERLRGDDELMDQIVPGDFVVMHNGPREEIVEELETVFNDAVKTPVELKLGETEENVYVVRGTFELSDDVRNKDDLVIIESLSDTYSRPVRPDFDGFVEIIVLATGVPVLSEVASPPAKVKLVTKQQQEIPSLFNVQVALDSLTAQTGLTFTKERRKILTLTVAEKH